MPTASPSSTPRSTTSGCSRRKSRTRTSNSAAGGLGPSLDQALAFEKRHGQDYQVIYEPSLLYEHIDLMLDNPILQDKRVRQALIYAIARETIKARLFKGRQ